MALGGFCRIRVGPASRECGNPPAAPPAATPSQWRRARSYPGSPARSTFHVEHCSAGFHVEHCLAAGHRPRLPDRLRTWGRAPGTAFAACGACQRSCILSGRYYKGPAQRTPIFGPNSLIINNDLTLKRGWSTLVYPGRLSESLVRLDQPHFLLVPSCRTAYRKTACKRISDV